MGLINWIFDFYQQHKINETRRELDQARMEAARVTQGGSVDAERLERALGELALATKTIQRLMVDKGVCSPEEFRNTLQRVDLEDGRADGRSPVG